MRFFANAQNDKRGAQANPKGRECFASRACGYQDMVQKIGQAILIGLVFLLPLTMYLGIRDSFDLPKMVLVYLAATALLCIWTLQMVLPSPPPSPHKGEGVQGVPSPPPSPHKGEGVQGVPSPPPSPLKGEGVQGVPSPPPSPLKGEGVKESPPSPEKGEGKMKGRLLWKRSPLDVPLLVYLIVLGLATIFSNNPRLSFWGQYREYAFGFLPTLAFAVLFWMTVQFADGKKWISALVRSVAVSGCLVAVYAVMQYLGYELFTSMPKAEGTRIWATLGNPIYLGAFLAMVIPVVLGEWLFTLTPTLSPQGRGSARSTLTPRERGVGFKFLLPVFLLIMTGALMLTLSRSAWVGLAVAMVIFGLWFLRLSPSPQPSPLKGEGEQVRGTLQLRTHFLKVGLALTTLLVVVIGVHQPVRQRFLSIFNTSESSNAARIAGWRAAWEIFREYPVLGAGPDTFKETFRAKRNLAYVRATGPYTTQNHAHNDLLQIAATSGVLGLGAYLWVCITVAVMGFKLWKTGGVASGMSAGLFCGLAALFVQNQFNFSTVTTSALAAIYAGVLCATHPHPDPLPSRERGKSEGNHHPSREGEIIFSPSPLGGEGRVRGIVRALLTLLAIVLLGATGVLCWRLLQADMAFRNGYAFMSAKDYRQAVARLEDAIRFNPNVVEYRLALANGYRDMAASISAPEMRLPFLKKALLQAQEIVRLEPHNPDSHTNLGVAFMWLTQLAGEDHRQEAWNAFRKAVEIDQFSVETWAHLARTAHFLGDAEKEKQLWQKVLEIDPEHSTAKQMLGQSS